MFVALTTFVLDYTSRPKFCYTKLKTISLKKLLLIFISDAVISNIVISIKFISTYDRLF